MAELTPMMKQYFEIKDKTEDCILFYRLGDFYEMFYDDAILASKELDLTLTGRDCGQEERAPMCGVPFHSCESYIARLVKKGFKVAICEQTEDPALAKGLVKREVVRIITPGTVIESNMLDDGKNNYIASMLFCDKKTGVCFADISTGDVFCTVLDTAEPQLIINELGKFSPKEALMSKEIYDNKEISYFLSTRLSCMRNKLNDDYYDEEKCADVIKNHFKSDVSDVLNNNVLIKTLGSLLIYLYQTQKTSLSHINNLQLYTTKQYMEIDTFTRRNLELCENIKGEKRGSLLSVLDKTKTAMGARLLRSYIEQPLINPAVINKRLSCVKALKENYVQCKELRDLLKNVKDIERLMSRIVYQTANARDLRMLYDTLCVIPQIKKIIASINNDSLSEIYNNLLELNDLKVLIDTVIVPDPPFSVREGNIICQNYSVELDELRSIMNNSQKWLAEYLESEKQKTEIKNLKIGYNKVFGYYLEVTNSYKNMTPDYFIRKQTLVNNERFITEQLKEMENKILSAGEKINRLEYEIFCQVKNAVTEKLHSIQKVAGELAKIDVFCSLAYVANANNYVMPVVDQSDRIDIKAGRHPVVEAVIMM